MLIRQIQFTFRVLCVDGGVGGWIATMLLPLGRSDDGGRYHSVGSLQLFCNLLALLEASVIISDEHSRALPEVVTTRGRSDAVTVDNETYAAMNRCDGVVVKGDTGSCVCSELLKEIRCRHLDAVPEFRRQSDQYSVVYLDKQQISSVPAAAFRHLRPSRIVLNFNPV